MISPKCCSNLKKMSFWINEITQRQLNVRISSVASANTEMISLFLHKRIVNINEAHQKSQFDWLTQLVKFLLKNVKYRFERWIIILRVTFWSTSKTFYEYITIKTGFFFLMQQHHRPSKSGSCFVEHLKNSMRILSKRLHCLETAENPLQTNVFFF